MGAGTWGPRLSFTDRGAGFRKGEVFEGDGGDSVIFNRGVWERGFILSGVIQKTAAFSSLLRFTSIYPAGTFVVFTNVPDGFKADLFQDINVYVRKLLYIDAGLAHCKFSQFS